MDTSRLDALLERGGGLATHAQAVCAGIDPHLLLAGVRDGTLERVQRGVYRRTTAECRPFETLLEVQLRIPLAVTSGASALAFHGLTTFLPKTVEISLPRNRLAPKLAYPKMQVFYLPPQAFRHGQEEHDLGGQTLRVYSAERTLADLLRQGKHTPHPLLAEGLRTYLERGKPDIGALLEAARVRRVEPTMRDYLSVLVNADG